MNKTKILVSLVMSFYLHALEVNMAFGEGIPPYCIQKTNMGIELEVMRAALEVKGHKLIPHYFPLGRVPFAFDDGNIDAVMTDLGEDLSKFGRFYGDSAVIYDNVFITLNVEYEIKKPKDLDKLHISSFQGAYKRYPEWLSIPKAEGRYSETSKQELQIKTLVKKRFDAILSDINIFKYYKEVVEKSTNTKIDYKIHHFTEVNPLDYRPIFKSATIRDDFNFGLKTIKDNGKFSEIYRNYIKDFQ